MGGPDWERWCDNREKLLYRSQAKPQTESKGARGEGGAVTNVLLAWRRNPAG